MRLIVTSDFCSNEPDLGWLGLLRSDPITCEDFDFEKDGWQATSCDLERSEIAAEQLEKRERAHWETSVCVIGIGRFNLILPVRSPLFTSRLAGMQIYCSFSPLSWCCFWPQQVAVFIYKALKLLSRILPECYC